MSFKNADIKYIPLENENYPFLLKEISNPPKGIYFLGQLSGLQKDCIAIVGTRKATSEGKIIAKELAKKLAELDITIVSGLAMGIDTAAHEGALLGRGKTIAVLGNGLDYIYPHQNENLAKKILETGGALVSEYPLGAPSLPHQFLERNRIVSGLSIATIVVEAPEQSGALVTARLAAEQGREVLVVPGPIKHSNYRGSHQLIRDGARLICSIENLLEDLNLTAKCENNTNIRIYENIKDKTQLLIIEVIQKAGTSLNIDKIIELTKLEPQIVNQSIAFLTIQNIIKETEKGYTL